MKKIASWVFWIAVVINIIVQGIMGLKLLDGNYDLITKAYIAGACFVVMFVCILIKFIGRKCPHCGKIIHEDGAFCPHCGKNIR